ncbi:MAG: excisionase family DNA-binding protein [Chloroflexi bacterium]|nr:excisionase family DNA-binding protein [Chloroflexota bacterium]
MPATTKREPIIAREAEKRIIRNLEARLVEAPRFTPALLGPQGEQLPLPVSVYKLLMRMIHELGRGNGVTIVPVHAELTTQQAADLVNVSRPFLVKLLESGEIPFHYVGTHRRIRFKDLQIYDRKRSKKRRAVLTEMIQDAQDMGEYDRGKSV